MMRATEFRSTSKLLTSVFAISKFHSSMNIINLEERKGTTQNLNRHIAEMSDYDEGNSSGESEEDIPQESIWYATILIELGSQVGSSLIERVLDALLFLLTQSTAYPYRIHSVSANSYIRQTEPIEYSTSRVKGKHCRALSYPSMRIHEDVSSKLEEFSWCLHDGVRLTDFPYQRCFANLQDSYEELAVINPPIAAFCGCLLQGEIKFVSTMREVASSFAVAIDHHLDHAEEYLDRLDQAITPEASGYWREFGCVTIPKIYVENRAEETGICFPGRDMYRPYISFEGLEAHECNKTVLRTDKHSDGILTVQCVCAVPKLLGFVVTKKPESTEVALNSILTHFQIPPRVVFYDNACNLFASAILRVPWLLNLTRFLVDRFHYKSHVCSSLFDPSSYRDLDMFKTTGAESINARIEKVLYFLRHLRGKN